MPAAEDRLGLSPANLPLRPGSCPPSAGTRHMRSSGERPYQPCPSSALVDDIGGPPHLPSARRADPGRVGSQTTADTADRRDERMIAAEDRLGLTLANLPLRPRSCPPSAGTRHVRSSGERPYQRGSASALGDHIAGSSAPRPTAPACHPRRADPGRVGSQTTADTADRRDERMTAAEDRITRLPAGSVPHKNAPPPSGHKKTRHAGRVFLSLHQPRITPGRTPALRWCRRSRSCWTSPCSTAHPGFRARSGSLPPAGPARRCWPSRR